MIIRQCLICNKNIKVSPSQENSKKFCSKSCFLKRQYDRYKGSGNPAYKGGTALYTNGRGATYRYIIGKQPKIPEHRYIMEQYLGRTLEKWEEVHHINGNKLDNRIENLFVFDKKNHSRKHFYLFKYVQELEFKIKLLEEKLKSFSSP